MNTPTENVEHIVCIKLQDEIVGTVMNKPTYEVNTYAKLELKNISPDGKINMLQSVLQSFEKQSIVVLTETDYKARVVETPKFITTKPETYVDVVSINDTLTKKQQKWVFDHFLNGNIKIISLSYDLMASLIDKYKTIEADEILAFDLPQNLHQYCMLNSSTGLKSKEVGLLIDTDYENDCEKVKYVVHFLKKFGKAIPDCLLNMANEPQD